MREPKIFIFLSKNGHVQKIKQKQAHLGDIMSAIK